MEHSIITSYTRSELAIKYRMHTKTLSRKFKAFGLDGQIKGKRIIPAIVVKRFVELYGHWNYHA